VKMAKRMHIDDDMGIDKISETLKMGRTVQRYVKFHRDC